MAERGTDGRRCFAALSPVPPEGRVVRVESSDEAVLAEVMAQMGTPGEPALEYRCLPDPGAGLPEGLVVASSVADIRKEPSHASELVTQTIYGDGVEPLKAEGEWYLVRLDDGYVGWIRSWHTVELSPADQERYAGAARHRVATNHAEVLGEPVPGALPVTDLVVGTRVRVGASPRRGWRAVALADGKEGFVESRSLEPIPRRRRPSRDRLAATGLRFLGIPYLWGGSTPKGFDCSGLIQRIFRLNGVLLPRDSDLQAEFGRPKPQGDPAKLRTGDLMFFGSTPRSITHVAMVLPEGRFLHAYGQVRVGSLDPGHRLYEANLLKIWQLNRDPLDTVR
jgi:cell wall-associated NlpC family hydrolase